MRPNLNWLMGLRLLVAVVFLATAAFLQLQAMPPFPLIPLYVLVGLTFFLSLAYLLLKQVGNRTLLCHLQLFLDLLLATAFVHYTGGVDSTFSFLYLFIILAAGTLLGKKASLLWASLSTILYGALMDLEFYGLVPQAAAFGGVGRSAGYVLFQVSIHIAAFFLVALLSSHLAERLQEARLKLEERSLDLRNLQTLHRDIVANIPSGIATFDLTGRLISFNEAAERITGYKAEALGEKLYKDTPFAAFPGLEEFFASPRPSFFLSAEVELKRQDGRSIPVGVGLSPLRDADGTVLGLIAIFQDLTEKRRIEERLRQADRLAAVGHLAASIAHEIRNPLAAISGSIQVLKEELELSGRDHKLLEIVLREADRLKLITGQFLEFVRPKAARPRECELGSVLGETVTLLEKCSERHPETKIIFEGPPRPTRVLADPDQLRQVFWNICLNALQAMPKGGTLTIATRVTSEGAEERSPLHPGTHAPQPFPPHQVEISFSDTGGGVPDEALPRIFDPFYTTKAQGTGLGLSIAKKLVEGLGGVLEVENRTGKGMIFRILLKQTLDSRP